MQIIYELNEIELIAAQIIDATTHCRIFTFSGELGAGKTTLISNICKLWKVQDTVSSPTYSLIQQYLTFTGEHIYHIDLYRINDDEEALNAGIEDCIYSGDKCLVEWPEKVPSLFTEDCVRIYLEQTSNNQRKITMNIPDKNNS